MPWLESFEKAHTDKEIDETQKTIIAASTLASVGNISRAIRHIEGHIKKFPDSNTMEVHSLLGDLLARNGHFELSAGVFGNALRCFINKEVVE
ncbi:MAG: hypothetical protein Q8P11_03505 [bacterium]|nr:hypothetical protein [bacterium]